MAIWRSSAACLLAVSLLSAHQDAVSAFTGTVLGVHKHSANCGYNPSLRQARQVGSSHFLDFNKITNAPTTTLRFINYDQNLKSTALYAAWPRNRDPKGVPPDYPKTKSRLAVTILAALTTWYAHNCGKSCGAVLASSATTLAASLWSPGLGQAAFAGSFAGMSSIGVLTNANQAFLAGALTAGLFEALIHRKNQFLGLGGRLGFLAFIATNTAALSGGVAAFPPNAVGIPVLSSGTTWSQFVSAIQSGPLGCAAICAALGSVATIALRETAEGEANSDMADPVRASAVIGLVAALLLGIRKNYSDLGALMAFGGSFTGMSLPSRLVKGVYPGGKKRSVPQPITTIVCFAAAGALGGLIHAATIGLKWWSVPSGWGGKAGACAFAGVLVFRGIEKIIYKIRKAVWGAPEPNYGELY